MNPPKLLVVFLLLLTLHISRAAVGVVDNGNGTMTMTNGLVSMTFSKADGSVSSFYLTSLSATNLIESSQDYALSLTHIGSGTNDYWMSINSPINPSCTVVTNNGQIVDVMLDNPIAGGNAALFPNGIWEWMEHHVMRAGEAGFYTYHVWRHHVNQPQAYFTADSWQGRLNSMFSESFNADGSLNKPAWSFSGSDVPIAYSIGGNPLGSTSAGVPGEVVILPYTNYWTQPAGTNYEPGWPAYSQPCGLTSDLHPTWTKYDYSSYQGPTTSARNAWGDSTETVGVWTLLGSAEFINGGPTKLKGAVSGDYMYNDNLEGHGLGSVPNPGAAAGEAFTKVIGPYFMYANTGTNHLQLWQDAQNMGAQMTSNWPFAWMNESEQDYPRHRGTVVGEIIAKTGESTANPVVILGNTDPNAGDWINQGVTNYLFWTTGDTNGNFSIPKVRPGNYVLYSYVPGIWGQLQISNIVVTADQTNNLGVIGWNPPHLQQRLWRIGTPDHSTKEFRFGNLPKQFGLWWRYLNERGQNDLNFTIGQSVESNDWYYAQCIMAITPQSAPNLTDHTQTNGTYWGPRWNVIFNLTNLPPTPVVFTLALAGGRGTAFYTYINGVNATPSPYQSTGYYTMDGANIYRDVVATGRYQYYQISFATNLFVVGTNTLSITVRQGGAATTWNIGNVTNGYPDLLSGGIMYDFLQMETGPQMVISSPPAAPGGLSVVAASGCEIDLSWANNATNATSVEIFRSTNNVIFTQIGAVANNVSTYADTGLSAGTTFSYRVFANNADGNSPNSSTAQTSTIAAQPPAMPGDLTASGVATNQINVNWADNSTNEDGFNLERSTNGGNYFSIAMIAASVTNYSDTGLTPGATYYYRAQAFRSCWGNSPYTAPASATTFVPPVPVVPVGLVAIPGNAKVNLSWIGLSGASSYNLKRAVVGAGPYTVTNNLAGTSYSDATVINDTTYYYVVSALNPGGEGNNSLPASATPQIFNTAYWTNLLTSAAQSWDANANWTNTLIYPNAMGVVANVTANIAAPQTNNLDQNITLGWLNIGDANGSSPFTLAPNGGSLIFNIGASNNAGIMQSATSAGDTITAPIAISNNLSVVNYATAHTLTLAGTISGTSNVTYIGPGQITLGANNSYGGTILNGATVILANTTANQFGLGSGTVTFNGGTLQFNGYDGNGGTDWGGNANTFNVPSGHTGTLLLPPRFGYTTGFTSALTGGGTFKITVDYIRDYLSGNWSAFTGQIIVSPRSSTGDFRINNVNSYASAAFYLNSGVNFYTINNNNLTVDLGELGGASGAYIGTGSGSATNPTWRIGAKNTTKTYAGIIADAGVTSLVKIGTGTLILSGANTYSGTTTISGGALQIGNGGTSGTPGMGNLTDNASLVFNRYDSVSIGNTITGVGSLSQAGFGVLTLSTADTYSGATFVNAGTLALTNSAAIANSTNINLSNGGIFDVSGTTGHAMTLGNGKMLSGEGFVNGDFTIASGATLAPGNHDLGALVFNNSLTLNPGGKTILFVSHDLQTNNFILVNKTLALGGSLMVSNADDPLQGGDSFQLFTAGSLAGVFSSVTLPALTPGLYWATNALAASGVINVGIETAPVIASVNFANRQLVLSGSGGATNGTYYILTSTNLALPTAGWRLLLTNQFDANGNFNLTNTPDENWPQNFYRLQLP